MQMDKKTIYVIIYAVLTALIWVFLFLPFHHCFAGPVCHDSLYLFSRHILNGVTFIGAALILTSLIFLVLYTKTVNNIKTGLIGFGLGVFGWSCTLIGSLEPITNPDLIIMTGIPWGFVIFSLALIVVGILLLKDMCEHVGLTWDQVKNVWGLINLSLLELVFTLSMIGFFYYPIYLLDIANPFFVIGTAFFVPTFILNLIFIMLDGKTSKKVGFYLGITGVSLSYFGVISFNIMYGYASTGGLILYLILISLVTLSGIFVFMKVDK
ncbi:MAG: hypothetical protein HWN65_00420 [Candidatus Helarchaeota archaeon]|nr:hypothetical protein [Candidatus Helarchaeota archaeon]